MIEGQPSDGATDKLEVPAQTVAVSGAGPVDPTQKTIETALISEGQRRINLIWERTQAVIALSVVEVGLVIASYLAIANPIASDGTVSTSGGVAFIFLVGAANLVIGFYFGRTNHQKIGGVDQGGSGEVAGR